MDAAKAVLRRDVRASRRARTADERRLAALGLRDVVLAAPVVAAASRVACYVSTLTEPGTGALRRALRDRGCEVLLPLVAHDPHLDRALDWVLDDGTLDEPQPPGRACAPEPAGPRLGPDALAGCDVALVPALAVDESGARLGQGGGYYDRALSAVRVRGPVIALVHDDELLPAGTVPVLGHDVRVDAVATPSRWITAPRSGRAEIP